MFDSAKLMYSTGGGEFYDHPIEQSLRLNDDDDAYLSRTPSSAGNRKTWTYSVWFKLGEVSAYSNLFALTGGSTDSTFFEAEILTTGQLVIQGWSTVWRKPSMVFRDPSSWYHLVISVDTTQATSGDRIKVYVNGEQITDFSTSNNPSQNYDLPINSTSLHTIGSRYPYVTQSENFDGYMAEVNFIDGTALDATSFGEFKSGVWIPKAYEGSYGTNGFYLDFDGTYYNDKSGNGNNWTANNLAATDVVLDSPTNNFATFNPLHGAHGCTLSEGNLYVTNPDNKSIGSNLAITSGKWVAEVVCDSTSYVSVGICRDDEVFGTNLNGSSEAWVYSYVGAVYKKGTADYTPTTFTTGDIITLYLDLDNHKLYIYKNNSGIATSEGTHSVGSTGISLDSGYGYYFCTTANGNNALSVWNFGQDSSFAGNKTAQGNTDENGYGDFYYAPPSGYLALCTANLPDPVASIDPAQDGSPQDHFNTVLYTGDGDNTRQVTGVGFQPDFTWVKRRNTTGYNVLFDAVRGATNWLYSNATDAEDSASYTDDAAFISDGFKPDNAGSTNASGSTYVAWNWKANGSGVSNTDGSITSTVSANTDAGFSIVGYTGNGTALSTVGHGLSSAPEVVIVKNRDNANHWAVLHTSVGLDGTSTGGYNQYYMMYLSGTAAKEDFGDDNILEPTSSTFMVGTGGAMNWVNGSGYDYIAYCFHSVDGFSKFGSYTGNGSTDGPFCYTGFKPAFILTKRTNTTGDWYILDTARNTYNVAQNGLRPNLSDAEFSGVDKYDILSNGFKIRGTDSALNASGSTYIYACFSENPFKYSTAR